VASAPDAPALLVLEPDETLGGLLEVALSYAGFAVEVVPTSTRLLAEFCRRRPTLAILDIGRSSSHGMSLLHTLRTRSDMPIILLTAPNATTDRIDGLNSGADDCITKPFKFEELTARMRSVLRRHRVTLTKLLVVGSLKLDCGTRDVTDGGRPVKLTPREFDLLEYFMRNPRQVLTRESIVNRVWGYDADLVTNVVDVYVRYLRAKLGDVHLERITSIRGLGYALQG
jgi:DNA-binding response OmpR family regulator